MVERHVTRRSRVDPPAATPRAAARRDLRTVRAIVNIRGREWGLALGPGSVVDLNEEHGGRPLRDYLREDCLYPAGWRPSQPPDAAQAEPAEE